MTAWRRFANRRTSVAPTELPALSSELRTELIAIGAKAGGHFAGSLGALELSVGLHYVFDTPEDRVVWDVGHQAYAPKAVTGRLKGLWRVKKADGPTPMAAKGRCTIGPER